MLTIYIFGGIFFGLIVSIVISNYYWKNIYEIKELEKNEEIRKLGERLAELQDDHCAALRKIRQRDAQGHFVNNERSTL